MVPKYDAAKKREVADKMREKAESLGLEEKARLIASEFGKKTEGAASYPEGLAYTKERYVGKAAPCRELTLEIIAWSEKDFADKSGRTETVIYARKPMPLLSELYTSKIVYASEAPLGLPENLKVTVLTEKGGWLEDFEHLYSKALFEKEIKRSKSLADQKFKEMK